MWLFFLSFFLHHQSYIFFLSDWIIEWLFCNSTGYPGKDAYPPPGYPAQGYPPPGYPPQSYAPQYAQQPPPRQEVGFLEGWYVSLSLSSSYYVLILFPFSLVLLEFFGLFFFYDQMVIVSFCRQTRTFFPFPSFWTEINLNFLGFFFFFSMLMIC